MNCSQQLEAQLSQLDISVQKTDIKEALRALRTILSFRKEIHSNPNVLLNLFQKHLNQVPAQLQNVMSIEVEGEQKEQPKQEVKLTSQEIPFVLNLLLLLKQIDENNYEQALIIAKEQIDLFENSYPSLLSLLQAKYYYYLHFIVEKRISDKQTWLQLKQILMTSYRKFCVRKDVESQSILMNCILRLLIINQHEIEQAKQFVNKATFPDHTSNAQQARYLYYTGRIDAISTDYSKAEVKLQQALRKAPEKTALGFRVEVNKLFILVTLFQGSLPPRNLFNNIDYKVPLLPYLKLTQSVRTGGLDLFNQTLSSLENDPNYNIIQRLRHNVIRTGLKRITQSYSQISITDVANKLKIDEQDCELITAKAIREQVISGWIDHEKKVLYGSPLEDVYSTNKPRQQLHKRIKFCMELYNDNVKALQFIGEEPEVNANQENKEEIIDVDKIIELDEEDDF